MRKDIEWLKKEIDMEMIQIDTNRKERCSDVKYRTLRSVAQKIDQLDKPEVLSQEWIHEHSLGGSRSGYVWVDDLENLLVPKQELPVIPKLVADWIEELKQDKRPLYSAMSSLMNKTNHTWSVWKSANKNFSEIMAQAWINGYTVEEEPLYYIVDKNDEVLWFRDDEGVPRLSGSTLRSVLKSESKQRYQFTEQEIKDYDERFLAFKVPVEEVAE